MNCSMIFFEKEVIMLLNINKSKAVFFIFISGVLLLSNIVLLDFLELQSELNGWTIMLFISILVSIFIIKYRFKLTKIKLLFLFLWEMFILCVFLSKILNEEFILLEFLLYSIVVPLVYFNAGILKYKKIIIASAFFSMIPFLYYLQPWNRLGILITIIGVTVLAYVVKKPPVIKCTYILLLFLFVFLTEHRTSIITVLFVVLLTLLFEVLNPKNINVKHIFKRILLILGLIGTTFLLYSKILDVLFNKWRKFNTESFDLNSLSSRRTGMWEGIIKHDISLFGNGESYFLNTYGFYHAHNNFLQILGAYGIIALILFFIICAFILFEVIKNRHKLEYIYFFSAYFLIGINEYILFINTFFIYPSILFFVFVGGLINETSNVKSTERIIRQKGDHKG